MRRQHAWGCATGYRLALAVAAGVLALPSAARATHLDGFVWTFPTAPAIGVATGWFYQGPASIHQESSGWAGNFLGDFEEESLQFEALDALQSSALPPGQAYLSFDLLLSGDWGGNDGYLGPQSTDFSSFFTVVANGQTLLDTTFSTYADQAFPGSLPGSSNPAGTGSVYHAPQEAFLGRYVYHFDMNFQLTPFSPTCCTDVDITFSARFGPGYDLTIFDPGSWGIDNFVISSTPIPEPATGALVGLGLLLLAAGKRRNARL